MTNARNHRINGDRLWDSLMEMAKIGPGIAGGMAVRHKPHTAHNRPCHVARS